MSTPFAEEISPAARLAWARTRVVVLPDMYVVAAVDPAATESAASLVARQVGRFAALVVEAGGVTVVVEERAWVGSGTTAIRVHRDYRMITLDAVLDPGLAGYLAPALARLASAGIPVIPLCSEPRDHLAIRGEDLSRARELLEDLARSCAAGG